MSAKRKIIIDLKPGKHHRGCVDHRIPVVPGTGSRDAAIPENFTDQMIREAKGKRGIIRKGAATPTEAKKPAEKDAGEDQLVDSDRAALSRFLSQAIVAPIPDPDFQAMIRGASFIQERMIARQFDEGLQQMFGNLQDIAARALAEMDPSLHQPLEDHERQVSVLHDKVKEALPKLIAELARRNPGVPSSALVEHAMDMMRQQLNGILSVLDLYSRAFEQRLNWAKSSQPRQQRFNRVLQVLDQYMESLYRLWMNGDVDGNGDTTEPQIPLSSLKIGDKLLAMIFGGGLGTIPGAKGPVGLSLLLYPMDMLDWLSLSLCLNSHEGGHQIFADIIGFEDEMQQIVHNAISKVKLSSKLTAVSDGTVSTNDLNTKIVTDWLGEIEADVAGVLVNGPAFGLVMLMSFPALLIRDGLVKDAKQWLRTDSVYTMEQQDDGSIKPEFEPHPQDYIRVYFVAAMVEEIGYKDKADQMRALADKAVGKIPQSLTWVDGNRRGKPISVATADMKVIAAVVAKALIRTKLKCLDGKSLSDKVCWEDRQQAKAEVIKNNLLSGSSDVPKDSGSMYPTLVGSGAGLAFWEALRQGAGADFLTDLDENVIEMHETLRLRAKSA